MRRIAVIIALLVSAAPFFVSAQAATAQNTLDTLCRGFTGNPTGSQTFDQSGAASVMDTFLKRKVLCPSACFDVSIRVSVENQKLKIDVTGTDRCANPKPNQANIKSVFSQLEAPNANRNCNAGKGLPSLIAVSVPIDAGTRFAGTLLGFSIPQVFQQARTVGPKSRCDPNVSNVITAFTTNGNNGLDAGFNRLAGVTAPSEAAPATTPIPTVQNPEVTSAPITTASNQTPEDLSRSLQERLRLPAEQADALARSNPNEVAEMLRKAQTDTAGAQEIARSLNLNDETMRNIASLNPSTPPSPQTPTEGAPVEQPRTPDNTFGTQQNPGMPTQCGTDGLAGNIMRAESNCGRINSNPLSSVQGPYHFLCGTWQAYANQTGYGAYADCAYRNDPAISTAVMNARMQQFADRYGAQCQSAGLSLSSCQYGIHVFGENGFRQLYNAYLSNPSASAFSVCGNGLSAAACSNNRSIFTNGGTVAGIFGELDRRLSGNGVITPAVSVPSSPYGAFTSPQGTYTNYGPAYANMNPFSGSFMPNSSAYNQQSYNGLTSMFGSGQQNSPFSSLTNLFGGLFNQNQTQQQATQAGYQQAVVSIIAQPQTVYRGSTVIISWSSVGVRQGSCRILQHELAATKELSSSNEGSVAVQATAQGQMRFAITCQNASGAPLQQVTEITVQ